MDKGERETGSMILQVGLVTVLTPENRELYSSII